MKRIGLICILLLALVGVGVKAAQAYQTYLPIVYRAPSTPTPTITPTPTQTLASTPTKTSTPTQTQIPPALQILSSQSYIDAGWYHIVGEVRNNTNVPMEFVKIIATLYDDNGHITGTDFAYTELDVIPPGGKSPFETGTNVYAGTTNYKLQVQGREGTLGRQDLVISGDSYYVQNGWLHVIGEVQNTGTTPAEFVRLVVTLYDVSGKVIGTDFAYTELDIIPAGGSSPFETGTNHFPNFDHYEIQVQGR